MPNAVLESGSPAARAAWRVGFWPFAGSENLAEDHLVHVGRLDAGARMAACKAIAPR